MEVPSSLYYLVGTLIVANIGTIGSVLLFGAKAIWWISKLESRVDKNNHDIQAAHEKIRDLKSDIKELDVRVDNNTGEIKGLSGKNI